MPLSRNVYKQPPVKGRILYRNGDLGAPETTARQPAPETTANPAAAPSGEAAAVNSSATPQSGSAAGYTEAAPAAVPPAPPEKEAAPEPDPAAVRTAARELAEQEKDKWARVGYEQGYKQAQEKAEAEIAALRQETGARLKEAELCLREARQRSREIVAASEVKVVELAVAAAERLLQTQLELAPDKVIQIVREAMRLMSGGEKVTVFVSPADLGSCLGMQDRIKKEFNEVNRLEFLPDGELSRGSCRIESENGTVEYLLHEESRRLKELLLDLARREENKLIAEEGPAYGKH